MFLINTLYFLSLSIEKSDNDSLLEYAYVFKAQLEDAPINISRTLNDRMASIIEGMLEKNPKKRLSAKAVFAALYPKLVDETVKETEIKESKPKETPQPAKYGKYFTPAGDL